MQTLIILLLCFLAFVQASKSKTICKCELSEKPIPTPSPTCPYGPTPRATASNFSDPVNYDNDVVHSGYGNGMRCISFYGLETNLRNIVCSWKHPPAYYIENCKHRGFDTLRIPLSLQYIVEGNYQVLDNIFVECLKHNMSVILDFHRVSNNRQEESWDQGIQESATIHSRIDFLNAVISIVGRYERYPQLIGLNSWNEYVGSNIEYKKEWDRFVFDEVEASFPGRFYYFPSGIFWATTLEGYSIEDVPYANRVIYSVHKYRFTGTEDFADWDRTFGNLFPPQKLLVGEFGFRDPEDMEWGNTFVSYLVSRGIHNHCFWTIAHSGDTGGLWQDDCETFNENKMAILETLFNGNAGGDH